MKKIFELDPHVADLIAAGEVVERPASVVKELLENSIDAGAGVITVELQAGGLTFIRVTDNGCGIAPEDVKIAFLRHATSKLRGAEGLEAIGTLGFRGEALAAIASVSRIELLTREPGSQEGVSLSIEAGIVSGVSPAGCPEGTTIIVRDLFFNTPARLKFMKSDRAESSAVASTVLRCALSRPDVSIRFIRDGKMEYHTPGDSRVDSCVYSLFGREFSAGLIPAVSSDETVSVTGFVSSPSAARGNRSYQFFFVNGRPIQSRTLQAALEQACVNTLPAGRYPSCVLYITTSLGLVDVNVHPAKTEVRFVSDKQVFDGVYYAALGAVNNPELRVQNSESGAPEPGIRNPGLRAADSKQGGGFISMPADEFRKAYGSGSLKEEIGEKRGRGDYTMVRGGAGTQPEVHDGAPAAAQRYSQYTIQGSQPGNEYSEFRAPDSGFGDARLIAPLFRVIGEALKTYIIAEYQNGLWFIDKHAAHERIHFDALKRSDFEPMAQALITPIICRHGREGASILLENAELLEELGFAVESFGDDAVAVRRIPSEIDIADAEPVLSDICAVIGHGGKPEPAQRDGIYRAIACKSAIKAGKSSDMRELEALAARVLSGEIAQCPHGRPVAFEITKAALDRGFRRT